VIGHELGGRYEIIERVGGGGMALVYKALDTLLGRKVAVKILRQQFTNDDEFIKRFRREAQAAASLSHPNVVSIYDVGQDGDVHYIVMEYVEGNNLNEKIKEQAPLQIDDAVNIACQICDALDHAHQNQIIHRDIKPHNIMIGKNGRVKVTDFGIARAATSTDITETGSVLGSVHYFSPEHAKGIQQGAKSDLYSLGIVIYQMLTGKLPFIGESPISVALKHLQAKVEEPRKVNPLIPQSVENIILRSLRKNPDERYFSAKEMLSDLETCLSPERRNSPKLRLPADGDGDHHDEERTIIIPAIRSNGKGTGDSGRAGQSAQSNPSEWTELDEKPSRSYGWIAPTLWVIIIISLLGAMWYGIGWVKEELRVPEVEVPSVVGMTLSEAKLLLAEKKLSIIEPATRESSDIYAADVIMEQEKAGEIVRENAMIQVVVSSGPVLLEMDDYVGQRWVDVENALIALASAGVSYEMTKMVDDDPIGSVFATTPKAGETFNPKETKIMISVSEGKGTIRMPGVTNMKISIAEEILKREEIKYKIVREKTYAAKDMVFKQWPYNKDDEVDLNDEITLYVSDGLPDDAAEDLRSVRVPPAANGTSTKVEIYVTDSYGDNILQVEKNITVETPFTVKVVLSPQRNGVIAVMRDGVLYDTITITYAQARNASNPEQDLEVDDDVIADEEVPVEDVDAPVTTE
jgi:serine/threonine protein kinase/beta-lactam-binding protein with PASTA domain